MIACEALTFARLALPTTLRTGQCSHHRSQMTFLPPYSPDLNPVEFLWAWLKRHALANFCPADLGGLTTTARNKLKSAQRRPSIISACWVQAGIW